MKKKLIGVVAILSCQTALAGNLYIGAGFGSSKASDASNNIDSDISALASIGISSSASYDESARSFSLLGGYQVNKNVAIEAAYDYLGTYQFSGAASAGSAAAAGTEEDKVDAFSLSAVLSVNLTPTFSLYGKAGVAATEDKLTCSITGSTCQSESDSNTGPAFGAGGSVFLGDNSALRLEYDQFSDVGDKNNEYTAGNFSLLKLEFTYSI